MACEFSPKKKARNGLQSMCKGCLSLKVASYRNEYNSECVQRQTKLCTRCGITKQKLEFSVQRLSMNGLKCYCKQCDLERKREKRTTEGHNPLHKS
jgi:hypothetical protein